ncbi:MAG: DNA repair protein RecN [Clostridiales bacterium]|nr:DNA repair protein RecN [Clostridiales bacterium]
MLISLELTNIALIESLSVEFSKGLNILSGETGAGKSIVIDAVSLALGERADKDLIRSGCDKARVQALFDVSNNAAALKFLEEAALPIEDGLVPVLREISLTGRSVVRICGQIMPLASLKALSSLMVDVHGQHEHQSLLSDDAHLRAIDEFAADEIAPLKEKTALAYQELRLARRELKKLAGSPQELAQKLDMLSFQIKEIEGAKIKPGQEAELIKKRELFRNAQKIAQAVDEARNVLTGSVMEDLRSAARALERIGVHGEEYKKAAEKLTNCFYELEDASYDIAALSEGLDFDEREVDAVEDRLNALSNLKRKYGRTEEEILEYLKRCKKEHEDLASSEELIQKLTKKRRKCEAALIEACEELSEARKDAAERFCKQVLSHLMDLNMGKTRLTAQFSRSEAGANGYDSVCLMISPNPGEPLKPLSKTASGGELSRVMLALKCITAQNDNIGTMIFDEIDTGISGRVADAVGKKMAMIAKNRQVICITHLSSIAVMGDTHFLIEKHTDGERTHTTVEPLDKDTRVAEIARLSGGNMTESAIAHARDMLSEAEKYKSGL